MQAPISVNPAKGSRRICSASSRTPWSDPTTMTRWASRPSARCLFSHVRITIRSTRRSTSPSGMAAATKPRGTVSLNTYDVIASAPNSANDASTTCRNSSVPTP